MSLIKMVLNFVILGLVVETAFGLKCLYNMEKGKLADSEMREYECGDSGCATTICETGENETKGKNHTTTRTKLTNCNHDDSCNLQKDICEAWGGQVVGATGEEDAEQGCKVCTGEKCNADKRPKKPKTTTTTTTTEQPKTDPKKPEKTTEKPKPEPETTTKPEPTTTTAGAGTLSSPTFIALLLNIAVLSALYTSFH